MTKESFFLSTPIYYVNDVPHLGTAYTTVASDVCARYRRICGYDVFFLTGLDEHGQKVEEAARANNMEPKEWVDKLAPKFVETWKSLNISYDDFIRTTDEAHVRSVQTLIKKLYDKGDIYKGEYKGWYCVPDETYWNESDIGEERTCPDCHRPLTQIEEENYFFKLSAYEQSLLDYYEAHPDFIAPQSRANEVISFVKGGLKDLSISRANVSWGVELPWDTSHTVYVWFDALINYITAVGYADESRTQEFAHRWPADVHFVGKDIIRFHCAIWPAMLMAAELELPKQVFAHGFLMVKGERMGKSRGNAITPAELINIFGVDGYRYYFMRDVSFGQDGSISIESMVQRYNGDLANDWGNLCSRLFNMVGSYNGGLVPDALSHPNYDEIASPLKEHAATLYDDYRKAMDKLDYGAGIEVIWSFIRACNRYIEDRTPWNLAKDETKKAELDAVLYSALEAVRIAALYTSPFIPATSDEVLARMGLEGCATLDNLKEASKWGGLPAANTVVKGDPLFPRIVDEVSLLD